MLGCYFSKMKQAILPILFALSVSCCFSQIPNYIPTNDLVAWYPFSGNAHDESGTGNDGTVNGALLTSDRLGNPNSAFMFDGVDDHIYIGVLNGIAPTSSHSVSFWVNKDADGCDNEMVVATFDNPPTDNNNLHYGFKPCDTDCGTNMCMGMDFYANSLVASSVLDTSWVCWTLVYDSATLERSIYLGGNLIEQGQASASYGGNLDMVIGSTSWQGFPMGAFFTGKIDEVGIWKRALTPQEVSELCGEGMTVGLSEVSSDMTFDIYPNPSNGLFNVRLSKELEGATLTVFDCLGKVVCSINSFGFNEPLVVDLNALPSGVYSVRLNWETHSVSKRVVVK
jgi:hypothetical protein